MSAFFAPALLPVLLAAGLATRGAAASEGEGTVVVDLVVEDAQGRPILDLLAREVSIAQDGRAQTVGALEHLGAGRYELRYAPASGRAGAVTIGVLRQTARVRGAEGPQVKPRWIPGPVPFEAPLRAALEAETPSEAFPYDVAVQRFEARGDTLHHSFVAEIPVRHTTLEQSGDLWRARLAFLLRVKNEAGRTLHVSSLDQPLELVGGTGPQDTRRFVWTSHLHLRPGRYVFEVAAGDTLGSKVSVRRSPLTVEPWTSGLRVSGLTFLLAAGTLLPGEETDNPYRLQDKALVPLARPSFVPAVEGTLSLLAVVYPDPRRAEPVEAEFVLSRGAEERARVRLPLPPPGPEGHIQYVGGLRLKALQAGPYNLKLVATQGTAQAAESTLLMVAEPPPVRVTSP